MLGLWITRWYWVDYFVVLSGFMVSQIEGFSGHADADELLRWLSQFRNAPKQTFVVHGERDAADALRLRGHDQLGWAVSTVEHLQSVLV